MSAAVLSFDVNNIAEAKRRGKIAHSLITNQKQKIAEQLQNHQINQTSAYSLNSLLDSEERVLERFNL